MIVSLCPWWLGTEHVSVDFVRRRSYISNLQVTIMIYQKEGSNTKWIKQLGLERGCELQQERESSNTDEDATSHSNPLPHPHCHHSPQTSIIKSPALNWPFFPIQLWTLKKTLHSTGSPSTVARCSTILGVDNAPVSVSCNLVCLNRSSSFLFRPRGFFKQSYSFAVLSSTPL